MRAFELVLGMGLAASVWIAMGCSQGSESPTAPAAQPPAASEAAEAPAQSAAQPGAEATREAEQIFATRCFTCHGPKGAGDGPGSAGLTPPPRNFQDPAWQSSVDDEHIAKIIVYGGTAVGLSPMMPGNPDLMGKPEVVKALVAHVRSLARK